MRIIHVTDTSVFNYDGISTYVNELVEVSKKNGDDVLVLTTTPHGNDLRNIDQKSDLKIHAFKCLRFPGKPKFITVITTGLKKIITDFEPDLIWIHTIGTLGMQTADFANGKYKVVYTKHCFDAELWCSYLNVPKKLQWMFYLCASFFENKIYRASTYVVYHLNDISKVKDGKFYHKYLPVPPPLSARYFEDRKVKKVFTSNQKLTLGFCGRCDPDKGIANTFKGLQLFQQKYPDVDFEFVFIGDGTEAHLLKNKYPKIKTTITGYVDDVIPYLDQLDGFILSSHQETISLSSLEAYARGVTIFSVLIGYLSENSEKLNNFYLFNSPEQLADLIYGKLVVKNINSANDSMDQMNDFVISYQNLLEKVKDKLALKNISK